MRKNARDNISKFFYDSAKVSFAVLVIGGLARTPAPFLELVVGFLITLILAIFGIIMDFVPVTEN